MRSIKNRTARINPNRSQRAVRKAIEALEPRRLMSLVTVGGLGATLAHPGNTAADSINLSSHFYDPTITGTVVAFQTSQGNFNVMLTDAATPITVQNFLQYVNAGSYNGTFFHRTVTFTDTGTTIPVPPQTGSIFQGGGYYLDSSNNIQTVSVIGTNTVTNEVATETQGNIFGTIAMAKPGNNPDGATNEFFFNTADNSSVLDDPNNDGGFATFGTVMGDGLSVLSKFAALPGYNLNTTFSELPVQNETEAQLQDPSFSLSASNLVSLTSAAVVPGVSYTVTSDNPTLVTPTVTGNTLSFTYGAGLSGQADITIIGSSINGGLSSQTFSITVPDTANPTAGLVANPDTVPNAIVGTASIVVKPLVNDTDSLFAIQPGSLAVVTQPAHGTVTVDTVSGYVTYVPTAGYLGTDSFQYTVADTGGNVSAPATVSLNIVGNNATATIGTKTAKALSYTEPDGTVATVSVSGGTAAISFQTFDVTMTTANGIITASGPGANIASIVITPTHKGTHTSIKISASGGTDGTASVGGITDPAFVDSFSAGNVVLSGTSSFGTVLAMTLAALDNADLHVSGTGLGKLTVPTVTNSSLVTSGLHQIISNQWLNTDSGTHTITAASINNLTITGGFDENLDLTGAGFDLVNARIGQITGGAWSVRGVTGSITAATVDPSWTLTTSNIVNKLTFTGDFAASISCAAIGTMTVGGNMHDNVVQTTAGLYKKFIQFKQLKVAGAITSSVIYSSGNFGTLTAGSLINSNLYAAVATSVAQPGNFPTATTDLLGPGIITAVRLSEETPRFPIRKFLPIRSDR